MSFLPTSPSRPEQVRPAPHHAERAGPGEAAAEFDRGDFVLVAGTHLNSRLIQFGQKLRIRGADRRHVKWTHAALIVDRDGSLIEAVGTGVRRWHLDRYRNDDYVVVRLHTSEENRDEVVRFAEWALRRGSSYSRLSTVSIALIFDRDSAHIAPADLAKYFYSDAQAGAGEADSTVRTSSARERIPSLR